MYCKSDSHELNTCQRLAEILDDESFQLRNMNINQPRPENNFVYMRNLINQDHTSTLSQDQFKILEDLIIKIACLII